MGEQHTFKCKHCWEGMNSQVQQDPLRPYRRSLSTNEFEILRYMPPHPPNPYLIPRLWIANMGSIFLSFFFFFSSFLATLRHMGFPGKGSDLSHSCGNTRSSNPQSRAGDWTRIPALQGCRPSHWAPAGTPQAFLSGSGLQPASVYW